MLLKINTVVIPIYPAEFKVTVLDLDDADSTTRTADGTLSRDRIAVKRQIEMSWNPLTWANLSSIITAMQNEFFTFEYPDPMTGTQQTKIFYVGNRSSPIAIVKNGVTWWGGLELTLTEQ